MSRRRPPASSLGVGSFSPFSSRVFGLSSPQVPGGSPSLSSARNQGSLSLGAPTPCDECILWNLPCDGVQPRCSECRHRNVNCKTLSKTDPIASSHQFLPHPYYFHQDEHASSNNLFYSSTADLFSASSSELAYHTPASTITKTPRSTYNYNLDSDTDGIEQDPSAWAETPCCDACSAQGLTWCDQTRVSCLYHNPDSVAGWDYMEYPAASGTTNTSMTNQQKESAPAINVTRESSVSTLERISDQNSNIDQVAVSPPSAPSDSIMTEPHEVDDNTEIVCTFPPVNDESIPSPVNDELARISLDTVPTPPPLEVEEVLQLEPEADVLLDDLIPPSPTPEDPITTSLSEEDPIVDMEVDNEEIPEPESSTSIPVVESVCQSSASSPSTPPALSSLPSSPQQVQQQLSPSQGKPDLEPTPSPQQPQPPSASEAFENLEPLHLENTIQIPQPPSSLQPSDSSVSPLSPLDAQHLEEESSISVQMPPSSPPQQQLHQSSSHEGQQDGNELSLQEQIPTSSPRQQSPASGKQHDEAELTLPLDVDTQIPPYPQQQQQQQPKLSSYNHEIPFVIETELEILAVCHLFFAGIVLKTCLQNSPIDDQQQAQQEPTIPSTPPPPPAQSFLPPPTTSTSIHPPPPILLRQIQLQSPLPPLDQLQPDEHAHDHHTFTLTRRDSNDYDDDFDLELDEVLDLDMEFEQHSMATAAAVAAENAKTEEKVRVESEEQILLEVQRRRIEDIFVVADVAVPEPVKVLPQELPQELLSIADSSDEEMVVETRMDVEEDVEMAEIDSFTPLETKIPQGDRPSLSVMVAPNVLADVVVSSPERDEEKDVEEGVPPVSMSTDSEDLQLELPEQQTQLEIPIEEKDLAGTSFQDVRLPPSSPNAVVLQHLAGLATKVQTELLLEVVAASTQDELLPLSPIAVAVESTLSETSVPLEPLVAAITPLEDDAIGAAPDTRDVVVSESGGIESSVPEESVVETDKMNAALVAPEVAISSGTQQSAEEAHEEDDKDDNMESLTDVDSPVSDTIYVEDDEATLLLGLVSASVVLGQQPRPGVSDTGADSVAPSVASGMVDSEDDDEKLQMHQLHTPSPLPPPLPASCQVDLNVVGVIELESAVDQETAAIHEQQTLADAVKTSFDIDDIVPSSLVLEDLVESNDDMAVDDIAQVHDGLAEPEPLQQLEEVKEILNQPQGEQENFAPDEEEMDDGDKELRQQNQQLPVVKPAQPSIAVAVVSALKLKLLTPSPRICIVDYSSSDSEEDDGDLEGQQLQVELQRESPVIPTAVEELETLDAHEPVDECELEEGRVLEVGLVELKQQAEHLDSMDSQPLKFVVKHTVEPLAESVFEPVAGSVAVTVESQPLQPLENVAVRQSLSEPPQQIYHQESVKRLPSIVLGPIFANDSAADSPVSVLESDGEPMDLVDSESEDEHDLVIRKPVGVVVTLAKALAAAVVQVEREAQAEVEAEPERALVVVDAVGEALDPHKDEEDVDEVFPSNVTEAVPINLVVASDAVPAVVDGIHEVVEAVAALQESRADVELEGPDTAVHATSNDSIVDSASPPHAPHQVNQATAEENGLEVDSPLSSLMMDDLDSVMGLGDGEDEPEFATTAAPMSPAVPSNVDMETLPVVSSDGLEQSLITPGVLEHVESLGSVIPDSVEDNLAEPSVGEGLGLDLLDVQQDEGKREEEEMEEGELEPQEKKQLPELNIDDVQQSIPISAPPVVPLDLAIVEAVNVVDSLQDAQPQPQQRGGKEGLATSVQVLDLRSPLDLVTPELAVPPPASDRNEDYDELRIPRSTSVVAAIDVAVEQQMEEVEGAEEEEIMEPEVGSPKLVFEREASVMAATTLETSVEPEFHQRPRIVKVMLSPSPELRPRVLDQSFGPTIEEILAEADDDDEDEEDSMDDGCGQEGEGSILESPSIPSPLEEKLIRRGDSGKDFSRDTLVVSQQPSVECVISETPSPLVPLAQYDAREDDEFQSEEDSRMHDVVDDSAAEEEDKDSDISSLDLTNFAPDEFGDQDLSDSVLGTQPHSPILQPFQPRRSRSKSPSLSLHVAAPLASTSVVSSFPFLAPVLVDSRIPEIETLLDNVSKTSVQVSESAKDFDDVVAKAVVREQELRLEDVEDLDMDLVELEPLAVVVEHILLPVTPQESIAIQKELPTVSATELADGKLETRQPESPVISGALPSQSSAHFLELSPPPQAPQSPQPETEPSLVPAPESEIEPQLPSPSPERPNEQQSLVFPKETDKPLQPHPVLVHLQRLKTVEMEQGQVHEAIIQPIPRILTKTELLQQSLYSDCLSPLSDQPGYDSSPESYSRPSSPSPVVLTVERTASLSPARELQMSADFQPPQPMAGISPRIPSYVPVAEKPNPAATLVVEPSQSPSRQIPQIPIIPYVHVANDTSRMPIVEEDNILPQKFLEVVDVQSRTPVRLGEVDDEPSSPDEFPEPNNDMMDVEPQQRTPLEELAQQAERQPPIASKPPTNAQEATALLLRLGSVISKLAPSVAAATATLPDGTAPSPTAAHAILKERLKSLDLSALHLSPETSIKISERLAILRDSGRAGGSGSAVNSLKRIREESSPQSQLNRTTSPSPSHSPLQLQDTPVLPPRRSSSVFFQQGSPPARLQYPPYSCNGYDYPPSHREDSYYESPSQDYNDEEYPPYERDDSRSIKQFYDQEEDHGTRQELQVDLHDTETESDSPDQSQPQVKRRKVSSDSRNTPRQQPPHSYPPPPPQPPHHLAYQNYYRSHPPSFPYPAPPPICPPPPHQQRPHSQQRQPPPPRPLPPFYRPLPGGPVLPMHPHSMGLPPGMVPGIPGAIPRQSFAQATRKQITVVVPENHVAAVITGGASLAPAVTANYQRLYAAMPQRQLSIAHLQPGTASTSVLANAKPTLTLEETGLIPIPVINENELDSVLLAKFKSFKHTKLAMQTSQLLAKGLTLSQIMLKLLPKPTLNTPGKKPLRSGKCWVWNPDTGEKEYFCPVTTCLKAYSTANGLRYHMKFLHSNNRGFPEGYRFGDVGDHAGAEAGDSDEDDTIVRLDVFECLTPGCGKRYSSMNGLRYHTQRCGLDRHMIRVAKAPKIIKVARPPKTPKAPKPIRSPKVASTAAAVAAAIAATTAVNSGRVLLPDGTSTVGFSNGGTPAGVVATPVAPVATAGVATAGRGILSGPIVASGSGSGNISAIPRAAISVAPKTPRGPKIPKLATTMGKEKKTKRKETGIEAPVPGQTVAPIVGSIAPVVSAAMAVWDDDAELSELSDITDYSSSDEN
ncbi:UNVERIFIED_CONTAM: hypothetical protein HDU68_003164 [Siphonaria sp. JEL0065]|nr:hypothetical protein HDU68_003164 [Siphonaria sp. JEL0065]